MSNPNKHHFRPELHELGNRTVPSASNVVHSLTENPHENVTAIVGNEQPGSHEAPVQNRGNEHGEAANEHSATIEWHANGIIDIFNKPKLTV